MKVFFKKSLALVLSIVVMASLAVTMPMAAMAAEVEPAAGGEGREVGTAAFGSISIHQGITGSTDTMESNITKYYSQTGPLVIKISSIFSYINGGSGTIAVVNSAGKTVFSDSGSKYVYSGTYGLTGLENLPAGKYRIKLIWGSLDLGADGYKDFTLIKGKHPKDTSGGGGGSGSKTSKVKKINLNTTKVNLAVGKTATLKVKSVSPSGASKKVKWKSSKKSVATVSSAGKVKAKKVGKATITATAKDGSKKTAKCTVKVYKKSKSVSFPKQKTVMNGETATVKAKVKPSSAYQGVTYASSNKSIATINSKGVITTKYKGVTNITATTKDGMKKKATMKLTVKCPLDG